MKYNRHACFATGAAALAASVLASAALVAAPAQAILNGTSTTTARHPAMVALVDRSTGFFCGGTLIAPRKVLTAAHCVVDQGDTSRIDVVAGRTDLHKSGGQKRRVVKAWVHPKFDGLLSHDVAVLTLGRALPQRPARVAKPGAYDLYRLGRTATALGWGATGTTAPGETPNALQQTTLRLAPLSKCGPYVWPQDTRALRVCGVPATVSKPTSICRGDSGGPLMVGDTVIGVVSTGNKYCTADQPMSVFTRVDTLARAITSH